MNTEKTNSLHRTYLVVGILAALCLFATVQNMAIRRGPVHDHQVSSDLDEISSAVDSYVLSNNRLPTTLSGLTLSDAGVRGRLTNYSYSAIPPKNYSLCAMFETSTIGTASGPSSADDPDTAVHGVGKICFSYKNRYSAEPEPTPLPTPTPTMMPQAAASPGSNAKICATEVPNGAEYATAKAIKKIDLSSKMLQTGDSTLTFNIYWPTTIPAVYDSACKPIKLEDLKVGDTITGYVATNHAAFVIQRQ